MLNMRFAYFFLKIKRNWSCLDAFLYHPLSNNWPSSSLIHCSEVISAWLDQHSWLNLVRTSKNAEKMASNNYSYSHPQNISISTTSWQVAGTQISVLLPSVMSPAKKLTWVTLPELGASCWRMRSNKMNLNSSFVSVYLAYWFRLSIYTDLWICTCFPLYLHLFDGTFKMPAHLAHVVNVNKQPALHGMEQGTKRCRVPTQPLINPQKEGRTMPLPKSDRSQWTLRRCLLQVIARLSDSSC